MSAPPPRRERRPGRPTTCEGAPRDLGLAQGRAHSGAIRDRLAREGLRVGREWPWPRRFSRGASLGAGVGREIVRHYPHLAERLAGMAQGARLPVDPLMELHVLAAYEPWRMLPGVDAHGEGDPTGALVACTSDGRAQILRMLGAPPAPGARWVTRRSRPEVGFASLEVVQPWGVAGVAGVNEAGLAVALGARCEDDVPGSTGPPPHLLVQECLQRFDDIGGAVEWCLKRPVRSGSSLVLADEAGRIVVVRLLASGAVARDAGGAATVSCTNAEREAALRARLEGGAELGPELLVGGASEVPAVVVWIEPGARELQLRPA